jgi:hypothetical protein
MSSNLSDPTYDKRIIKEDIVWHLAFMLSEMYNDSAPMGWSAYIPYAKTLCEEFNIKPK